MKSLMQGAADVGEYIPEVSGRMRVVDGLKRA